MYKHACCSCILKALDRHVTCVKRYASTSQLSEEHAIPTAKPFRFKFPPLSWTVVPSMLWQSPNLMTRTQILRAKPKPPLSTCQQQLESIDHCDLRDCRSLTKNISARAIPCRKLRRKTIGMYSDMIPPRQRNATLSIPQKTCGKPGAP